MKQVRTNAVRLLETAGVAVVEKFYDVSDGRIDAVSVAQKIGEPVEQVFKTLVTHSKGNECYVFVVPAAEELDLKKAAAAAGCKSIEMLPQKQLLPLTGYVHGGCSPVGMKKKFPTFIDETALLCEKIYVSAGMRGVQLIVAPEPLCAFVDGHFADLIR